ncbi:MAG: hypothetical protein GWO07_08070 [Candidatus Dadabacteria bacterium]|nr:hypothetical protein [Candidatus Dadabacteria bacterium]NIS08700.1 hypothetical protein [Candidatus Dadabacteria bacterium]NIV42182.1 hypothetical protein [Candidatus Dadabacteria bacterium]NIX15386.1 hypothetical protein [Candidatus Dadabacteria bacterium]NIY22049.1 hypothetical protein [Candidatus Dadabacteria bacterium]
MGTIFDLLTGALAFAWRAISVRLFPQLKATLVKSFALRIIDLPSDAKIVDGMVQYRPGNSNSAYVNLPPNTTLNDLKEKYLLIIMEIENPDDKPNNIREYYVDFIEPTEFQYEVKLAYSIHPEKELYTHVLLKHCDYTIDQYLSEKTSN